MYMCNFSELHSLAGPSHYLLCLYYVVMCFNLKSDRYVNYHFRKVWRYFVILHQLNKNTKKNTKLFLLFNFPFFFYILKSWQRWNKTNYNLISVSHKNFIALKRSEILLYYFLSLYLNQQTIQFLKKGFDFLMPQLSIISHFKTMKSSKIIVK